MRGAVLTGPGPLRVVDLAINGPEAGEVLVRLRACGVCHSDLLIVDAAKGPLPNPTLLGHEAAGVVAAVGAAVSHVRAGDHVVLAFHPSCGRCFYCRRGQPNLCERPDDRGRAAGGPRPRLHLDGTPVNQAIGVGGFAEYACMPAGGVVRVRPDAPLETVCLVGCAVTTGVGAALWTAAVEADSQVAVIGCGGVGLNVIQGARLAGARRIIAVDLRDDALALATRFGATDLVNGGRENAVAAVRRLSGGYLDYAFESVGLSSAVEQAFAMVRPGGTAVAVGVNFDNLTLPGSGFLQEKRLVGSLYGSADVQAQIPRIVDLYMEGKLLLDELVTKRRPLSELNEAFADLRAGAVIRTVIEMP
jgi:S-(hydroxymethyl)glutathione dehydrogenase/alcohol dehydrogenase